MSIYTIAFIAVTLLVLIGLALFGLLIMKIDRWVDKKERLGKESLYKDKSKKPDPKAN
jgi:hypothetical protein